MTGLSPYIWVIVITWLGAHAVKYALALAKGKQLNFKKQVFVSGGMPSAHVATATALTAVIAFIDGMPSGLFALSALMTLIIAHDALRVRRSSGEQGEALIRIIKETGSKAKVPLVAKGHVPSEVIAGVLFGIMCGIVVYWVYLATLRVS